MNEEEVRILVDTLFYVAYVEMEAWGNELRKAEEARPYLEEMVVRLILKGVKA